MTLVTICFVDKNKHLQVPLLHFICVVILYISLYMPVELVALQIGLSKLI